MVRYVFFVGVLLSLNKVGNNIRSALNSIDGGIAKDIYVLCCIACYEGRLIKANISSKEIERDMKGNTSKSVFNIIEKVFGMRKLSQRCSVSVADLSPQIRFIFKPKEITRIKTVLQKLTTETIAFSPRSAIPRPQQHNTMPIFWLR